MSFNNTIRYHVPVWAISLIFLIAVSCGPSEQERKEHSSTVSEADERFKVEPEVGIMTDSKGVGPVSSLEFDEQIDEEMAKKGRNVFGRMCTVCHQIDTKVVGPALKGITRRRQPEWIMNMILNPVQMVEEDPVAIALYREYETPMNKQAVSEEEARQILEYFRQEDQ